MKRALPANAKIAKDAKETVQECVSEFISFITSECVRVHGGAGTGAERPPRRLLRSGRPSHAAQPRPRARRGRAL
jgi:hypothetical protein